MGNKIRQENPDESGRMFSSLQHFIFNITMPLRFFNY